MRKLAIYLCGISVIVALGAWIAIPDPCCENPEDFREMVARQAGVDGNGLEAAEKLLQWAATTTDIAEDGKAVRSDTEPMPPHRVYTEVFEPDEGGVYCGGASTYYRSILHLFGIDAFTINFGTLEDGSHLTHVTVIVPHEGAFYMLDPTYGVTYREDGELVPMRRLLAGDLNGVEMHEMPLSDRDYVFAAPGNAVCRTEATKTGPFYTCGIGDGSPVGHALDKWRDKLTAGGYPIGVATFPALMREGFFSVGPSLNPDSRKRFLDLLAEYNIPMK